VIEKKWLCFFFVFGLSVLFFLAPVWDVSVRPTEDILTLPGMGGWFFFVRRCFIDWLM
jgi:hypothetical protein